MVFQKSLMESLVNFRAAMQPPTGLPQIGVTIPVRSIFDFLGMGVGGVGLF